MPNIQLESADGHRMNAYFAQPEGPARGAIVVIQEIFGVNAHIRSVTARFAAAGYVAIAPALFDRVERDVSLGYDAESVAYGRELVLKLTPEGTMADVSAALQQVEAAGKVAIVGYCYGGAVAWVAAAREPRFSCALSYYGSRIVAYRELAPRCPTLLHVGSRDASFPLEHVRAIVAAAPNAAHYEYAAGHGFNCDHRADFDADAAALALERSFDFLATHVG